MKRIVKADENKIELYDLKKEEVTELCFENEKNWFIIYHVQQLDYQMEYCQSTGRGEIVGTCIVTYEKGEIPLNFTSDGKKNMEILRRFSSEEPTFVRKTIKYYSIIQKN